MTELSKRKRNIDLNKLTVEQADVLSAQIGKELAKIIDEANLACAKILKPYGLQTVIGQKYTEKKERIGWISHENSEKLRYDIKLKIRDAMNTMNKKCNDLLHIYGLKAQMSYDIIPIVAKDKEGAKL